MSSVSGMSLMVKICGITRAEDARAAVDAGADALGFMFYQPSKRFVTPEAVAEIIAHVPESVNRVGVFVDANEATVRDAVRVSGVNVVQFHGAEPPAYCASFRSLKVWKAVRVKDAHSLELIKQFDGVDALLLDSYVPGELGGTGHTFNWDLAVAAKAFGRPVIVAGGLTAENIGDAVRAVRPFGVDVSSGVESSPGLKDAKKIHSFIRAARQAAG